MQGWKGALLALVGLFVSGDAIADDTAELKQFYAFDRDQITGIAGEVVRSRALSMPVRKGKGYRVLCRTVGTKGRPTIASTLVFYPDKKVDGDRKVVVWAHATTGIRPRCAPSRLPAPPYEFMTVPGLEAFLEDGFVVVAPDYVGLGGRPRFRAEGVDVQALI